MSKDPEFLILKQPSGWLPESDWEKLLGTSVRNHLNPSSDYAPENANEYRTSAPSETKFEDFILNTEASKSGSFQLEVNGLGKLRWERSAGKQLDLRGKVIYVKRLRQQSSYWKSIMKCDEFRDATAEWINEAKNDETWWSKRKRPICLVVGVLLCQDVDVDVNKDEELERVAKGDIPLGTVTGVIAAAHGGPPNTANIGDASVNAQSKKIQRHYFKAKGKDTYVCGLELRIIKIKKETGSGENALVLTDDAPQAEQHRKLGPDDEDIDADDLSDLASLHELDENDWEDLFQDESDTAEQQSGGAQ